MSVGLKRCSQCGASSPGRRSVCDLCATPFETSHPSTAAALATVALIAIGHAVAVGSAHIVVVIVFALLAPTLVASIAPRTRAVTVASGIVLGSAVVTLAAPSLAKEFAAGLGGPRVHWALAWLVLSAASAGIAATCVLVVHWIRSVEYNR